MIRPVLQLGDPHLLEHSQPASFPLDAATMEIVRDLLDTMAHFKSVGIAAPQIGYPIRAFVMSTELTQRKDVARIGPLVFINPTVVQLSGRCSSDHEGCLSSGDQHGNPYFRAAVDRAAWVDLEWFDQNGGSHRERFQEFHARIVQHEMDHLDGRHFVHRLTSMD